jgi:ATP-dependent Clp protease protease subunit
LRPDRVRRKLFGGRLVLVLVLVLVGHRDRLRAPPVRLTGATQQGVQMETNPPAPAAPETHNAFLEEKAFESRTVLVFGPITDSSAADTARRLVALDAASKATIDMLVSSPGGHLESGDALHDIVRFIAAPVRMIGTGWVGSAATHLFLAVPKERRFCLPNTRFLIHQPSGGAGGQATDIAIMAREILKARERIARVIARETGRPLDTVLTDIERDRWMSAEEAVDYGLVSRIVQTRADLPR